MTDFHRLGNWKDVQIMKKFSIHILDGSIAVIYRRKSERVVQIIFFEPMSSYRGMCHDLFDKALLHSGSGHGVVWSVL